MHDFDYEIEKNVVCYRKSEYEELKEKTFFDVDEAIEFARTKYQEGFIVTIKEIRNIVGWCE